MKIPEHIAKARCRFDHALRRRQTDQQFVVEMGYARLFVVDNYWLAITR